MLIPPRILSGVAGFASTDPARFQLCGVFLERDAAGKPHATATDGKVLATATWEEDDAREFPAASGIDTAAVPGFHCILPNAACKEAAKMPPKSSHRPVLLNLAVEETTVNGTLRIGASDLDSQRTMQPKTVDGAFPDCRIAMNDCGSPDVTIRLNPVYVIQAMQSLVTAMGGRGWQLPQVVMTTHGDKPVRFQAVADGVTMDAYVMPINKA